jgi:glycosyltransferase involved in cell wall biosynthesis
MKIAMIGQKGIPALGGGVEKHVEELAVRMVELGHEVTVYCRSTYMEKNITDYKGVKLKIVKTINLKSLDAIVYSIKATLSALFKNYDIYHYHALGPASTSLLPRVLGKKVIVTVHGLDWQREKWGKFGQAYLKYGEFITGHFAKKIISVSENLRGYFINKYNRKSQEVVYIPNGVKINFLKAPKEIFNIGLAGNDYFLFLARLVPEKGAHYLIEAYNQLETDIKLVIAGGASFSEDYVNKLHKISETNKNIIFTGSVSGELLEELYSNCKFYILPSDIEGMPLTLLEALSYGKRALVSDIPENMQVIKNIENCYSFNKGDIDALKRKLEELVRSDDLYDYEKIIEIIKKDYSWDNVVQEYIRALN